MTLCTFVPKKTPTLQKSFVFFLERGNYIGLWHISIVRWLKLLTELSSFLYLSHLKGAMRVGLYKNFCETFGPSPGQNIDEFRPPKNCYFCLIDLNFWDNSRNLKFMFFDSPNLMLYANVLLFWNSFCFLGVNSSQKWTKSLHSESKFFLKNLNFSKIVETLLLSAIILHLVKNFTKIGLYLRKKGSKNTTKMSPHGCWFGTQNFENL